MPNFISDKNLPVILASIFAIIIAMAIILFSVGYSMDWLRFFLVIGIATLVFYVLCKILINKYIFESIALIYKIIRKSTPNDISNSTAILIKRKNLRSVKREVELWADEKQAEIDSLKTLEAYRKNFVGNISHELKTPLFSIQGYLHTLVDGGLKDEKINIRYLKKALKNVGRLQTIVNDLQIINKLESGEVELNFSKFDLRSLIYEVIGDMEMIANEKKMIVNFKIGQTAKQMVWADKQNIEHVLRNLVENAVKYGKENGNIELSVIPQEKTLLVEVSDNGMGIESSHLVHVFDRFYRVDKSGGRAQGGSGLGLSIVKHIIEAHGQSISLRSMPNVGSTFGFTLAKAD